MRFNTRNSVTIIIGNALALCRSGGHLPCAFRARAWIERRPADWPLPRLELIDSHHTSHPHMPHGKRIGGARVFVCLCAQQSPQNVRRESC